MALGRDKPPARQRMMVVPWEPRRGILPLVGVGTAIVVATFAGYMLGVRMCELDRDYLGQLDGRIRALELELEGSNQQLADANLAREIDGQALTIQREEMRELHTTIGELHEELAFYRGLMDSSSLERGLEVADFELIGGEEFGGHRFRILLTRPTQGDDRISGTLELEVTGLRAGREQVLTLPEISDIGPYPLTFRFRYLQRLSGPLTLPADFLPLRVTVGLTVQGENTSGVERTFTWPGILGEQTQGVSASGGIQQEAVAVDLR